MVVNVGADGKVMRKLEDPIGKVLSFVTTALEFEGHLYLGSLNSDYVGKLPLTKLPSSQSNTPINRVAFSST